ncbi:hypothetical protein PFICI_11819 [Pestalotiopsis fici W106-1]|uniref:Zn(2)-C6 fungal-type domain-containing protein n=1 Tax=Pestalotiopsis fici (strain W106-1 / CGMCC3.15140) TaxID=1229662 RepID=W3WTE9_PESFW|nr:uncharacterized protein PFICI_11819 [Pestalotiopsis fici W106-1]ETS76432.1 hypothetical protein PFICI_11819 [Pestalotiopsis fici W106-1]
MPGNHSVSSSNPRDYARNVTRTKGACSECRRRRRKCDLQKPSCRRCVSAKITCTYAATVLEFRDSTAWAAQKVEAAKARTRASHASAAATSDRCASVADVNASDSPDADCYRLPPASPLIPLSETTASPLTSRTYPTNISVPSGGPCSVSPEKAIASEFDVVNWDGETGLNSSIWMVNSIGSTSHAIGLPPNDSDLTADNSDPVYDESTRALNVDQGTRIGSQGYSGAESNTGLSPGQLRKTPDLRKTNDSNSFFPADEGRSVLELGLLGPGDANYVDTMFPWPPPLQSPPRSLQTTPDVPVGDRLYLAHFVTHVANLLPTEMQSLRTTAMTEVHVRLAAMAHGAAHLAFLQGAPKADQQHGSRWVSKEAHRKRGSELTARAWRETDSNSSLPLDTSLAVILLLCYHELEAGTFHSLWSLVSRLDLRIMASMNDLSTLSYGIMQGWSHIRALAKRTWPLVQPTALESRMENILCQLEEVYAMSRRVDSICIMAVRLMYRVISCKCLGYSGSPSKDTLRNIRSWWKILQGTAESAQEQLFDDDYENALHEDQIYTELQSLGERLQDCDIPQEFPPDFEAMLDRSASNTLSPGSQTDISASDPLFYFTSHDQAMSCADYAFAHIVTDIRLLKYAIAPAGGKRTPRAPNPWLALLQHIAQGLDIANCSSRNAYRMSIISQILCGALLCCEPTVLNFLDGLLDRMLAQGLHREDAMTPLLLLSRVINTLQNEFRQGRQIFLCSVTFNEWTAKEELFTSGQGECLIILGREASGTLFSDSVPLIYEMS